MGVVATKKSSGQKKDGVVYTPDWVVDLMIESLFSHSPLTRESQILDPACGDGAFFRGIVRWVLAHSDELEIQRIDIPDFLSNSLHGADIDSRALAECRDSLDTMLLEAGMSPPRWDLWHGNSLLDEEGPITFAGKITHVIANPPYIRIQDLDKNQRRQLQTKFQFCRKGSTDIFLAFFEFSLNIMAANGFLSFINSRSFFDSAAASDFRHYVTDRGLLREIIDFGDDQVFPDVTTYTAVTVLSKESGDADSTVRLRRHRADTQQDLWDSQLRSKDLGRERWHVVPSSDHQFINSVERRGPSLGSICSIRVGLATLRDKIYVCHLVDDEWEDPKSSSCLIRAFDKSEHRIEKSALRRIVKVSTVKRDDEDQRLAIIFPYFVNDGSVLPWDDAHQLENSLAMSYLSKYRESLDERGHDVRIWFEYGSTQGISTLFGEKILIPSMTETGQVFLWTHKEFTLYSGYAIFFEGDVRRLHDRLSKEDFQRYAKLCGRTLRGGWFSMTKSSLVNFSLSPEEWIELGVPKDKLSLQLFWAGS